MPAGPMELPEVGTNERSVLICPTGRTACQPHPGPDTADTADADVVARMAAAFAVVLADIRGSLERWGDDIDSAVVARGQFCIASAFVGLRRGDRLAADLRACAGRQRLSPAAVELLPLLSSMDDMLGRVLDPSIDVSVVVARDCPPCRVDARALEEALLTLVINARDAMPRGGRLRLSACADLLPDGSSAVAVSVLDSGAGMTPEVAQRAARPFFTTKMDHPLAGLGLAAVEGFVRQSGGSMALRSSAGAGTTVTLRLPRLQQAAPVR
jgi:signal transduction histidine kinase